MSLKDQGCFKMVNTFVQIIPGCQLDYLRPWPSDANQESNKGSTLTQTKCKLLLLFEPGIFARCSQNRLLPFQIPGSQGEYDSLGIGITGLHNPSEVFGSEVTQTRS